MLKLVYTTSCSSCDKPIKEKEDDFGYNEGQPLCKFCYHDEIDNYSGTIQVERTFKALYEKLLAEYYELEKKILKKDRQIRELKQNRR